MDFSAWVQRLRDELGRQDLFPAIHGSVQKTRRRLYVHLIDDQGDAVAFAKLALDPVSHAQMEREIAVLRAFQANPPKFFNVPRLLLEGTFSGHRYLVLAALPAGASAVSLSWQTLRDCLHELSARYTRTLTASELCDTRWWQELNAQAGRISPRFVDELRGLITDVLPVARVHGDPGVHNFIQSGDQLWILDWEDSSYVGPQRTDEIGHYLAAHQAKVLRKPGSATRAFALAFLEGASREDRRDVMAALAFLAAVRQEGSVLIWVTTYLTKQARSVPIPHECRECLPYLRATCS
jgi:Phosphotransferase enzyme family